MSRVHWYFSGERNESLLFIIIGLVTMVMSFYFWLFVNQKFYNGIGWPLLLVSIIQLTVGISIFLRSPYDERRVEGFLKNSHKSIRNLEIPRMEKVMKSFVIYRYVEMTLIVLGLILFLYTQKAGFWRGVSLGLIIQAGLMLIADQFAENRGKLYLEFLKNYLSQLPPSP
ncbi:MAG: hypothetical protein H6605_02665 [Flavobacteriales bacterium]|nr:hypothetical protein [Flavobacteriales bacterium]